MPWSLRIVSSPGDPAEVLPHSLLDRLQHLEPFAALGAVQPHALTGTVTDRHEIVEVGDGSDLDGGLAAVVEGVPPGREGSGETPSSLERAFSEAGEDRLG